MMHPLRGPSAVSLPPIGRFDPTSAPMRPAMRGSHPSGGALLVIVRGEIRTL